MAAFLIIFLWILPVVFGAVIGHTRGHLALGIILPLIFSWLGVLVVVCLSGQPRSLVVSQHVSNEVHTPTIVPGMVVPPEPTVPAPEDIHPATPPTASE